MPDEHDANGLALKYDSNGKPLNLPAMEYDIESIEIHWAGIGRLLLGLVSMPLFLIVLSGGLAGAYEPGHDMFDDYKWLASNWMLVHAVICCVCLPLFLLQRDPASAEWCSCILALLYCAHQYEEHAHDLSGRRFAFASHLGTLMKCSSHTNITPKGSGNVLTVTGDCGFDEFDTCWNNVYTVTGLLLLMPTYALPLSSRDAALFQNAVFVFMDSMTFHVVPAAVSQTYNPGFLLSLFANMPFSIYVIWAWRRQARVSTLQTLLAFCIGVAGQPSVLLAASAMLRQAGHTTRLQAHLLQACIPLLALTALAIKTKPQSAGKKQKASGDGASKKAR
jgi:hypothetical protein